MKYIFGIIVTLFFYGCNNSSDSTLQDYNISQPQISMQQIDSLLKDQNYTGVIEILKDSAATDEEYLALGEAYMGASGLSLSIVIDDILQASDENGSALMNFIDISAQQTKGKQNALEYLNKATDYYMLVIGDRCDDTNETQTLTEFEQEVCTYKGLAQTVESVTTINYVLGYEKDSQKASSCAMQYAFNKREESGCEITQLGDITFSESNETYKSIDIMVNDNHFEYLLKYDSVTQVDEVVVTDGYCSTQSFDTRVDEKTDPEYQEDFHVCPVNLVNRDKSYITQSLTDGLSYTTKEGIVDAFNDGTHSVLVGDINNTLLKEKIIEFKDEIIQTRQNGDEDDEIKTEDIVTFFQEQNF